MLKTVLTVATLLLPALASTTANAEMDLSGIIRGLPSNTPFVDDQLEGSWRVVAFLNSETGLVEPVYEDAHNFRVSFGDGSIEFFGGCNPRWGDVNARNGRLSVLGENMASTMRACPSFVHEEEHRFMSVVPFDGHYVVINDHLHLFDETGAVRVTLLRMRR